MAAWTVASERKLDIWSTPTLCIDGIVLLQIIRNRIPWEVPNVNTFVSPPCGKDSSAMRIECLSGGPPRNRSRWKKLATTSAEAIWRPCDTTAIGSISTVAISFVGNLLHFCLGAAR